MKIWKGKGKKKEKTRGETVGGKKRGKKEKRRRGMNGKMKMNRPVGGYGRMKNNG